MEDIADILNRITESLKTLNPLKIILFGSISKGDFSGDSDLDIYVALNVDIMPVSYEEKLQYKILVRNKILDISKQIPIDLIVHTKPMYERFLNLNSLFSKEILLKGKTLYESNV